MSNATLPALAGLRYPAKRRPIWSGKVQTAVSGKETRLSYWSYPRYQWTIGYEFLRTAAGANDLASLIGFYNARRGQFDDWLWTDPDDSSVAMPPIGRPAPIAEQLHDPANGDRLTVAAIAAGDSHVRLAE